MRLELDRYGFLTWTTYGSWLPGDKRGFVSNVRVGSGPEVRHNAVGTPYDSDLPRLQISARNHLACPPIRLRTENAEALLTQFQETAAYRLWQLFAVGIMANHLHLVVGVPGDPKPEWLLQQFKSYGSRALNRRWKKPDSGTWWTESGSKRKLPDENAVLAAVRYVLDQEFPLLIWTMPIPELELPGGLIDLNQRKSSQ